MKCSRFVRVVYVLAILTVVLVPLAMANDAGQNPATMPMPREDDWWQQRYQAMNNRVKQGNVDLIFIGDSITQAWEEAGKEVWKQYYEKRNAVNLGISGDQTSHVIWRLENGNIDGISPKLAVIMIGTNNTGSEPPPPAQTPEQVAAGIKKIVEILRTKLPETKILLLGIFPRSAEKNDPLRQSNMKVNEIIAQLADNKMVYFLDIGPKFLDAEGRLSKDIMPDLLHLSPKGYQIWAESIEPMVAKLMGE